MAESRDLIRRLTMDLQRASSALETLIDVLPIGIGVAEDPECRLIRINRAFAEQLGISLVQNGSLTVLDGDRSPFKVIMNGREAAAEDLPMPRAARTRKEVGPIECEVVHSDGRRVTLYEYAAPLFDADGSVRGAVGVFVDITERLRVERQQTFLAQASEILSSSLDYESTMSGLAKLAVPAMGDYAAVDVLREDGTCHRVEFVVGDESLRDVAEGLKRYPPRMAVDSPAAQALRSGRPLLAAECSPDTLQRAAQSREHYELLARLDVRSFVMAPLTARGRTLGLFTVGIRDPRRQYGESDLQLAADIARRAGLALDNALLYRHAQEANRVKDDFLATLSHELRTPLNALLGWTQMLRTRAADEAFRLRALESIDRNARAQAVLINDLLDVSRVMSGKLRIEAEPVDLEGVVLEAVDAVSAAGRARDIELRLSIAPLRAQVLGDGHRLQQVVMNLLSNAIKFTPAGGRIELSLEQTGGAVQIAVTDTGAGIDPAFLPYVFERFSQADSTTARRHGGLGLGLAIVRHLVELHGGTVTVESEGLDCGSRFVVTLPTIEAPAAAGGRNRSATERHASAGLRGIRILAVDDDADSRELLLLAMQEAGADVMAVGSATAALDALRTFTPHVIVADIAMPDLDGYDLMRAVAGRQPAVRGVALSAYVGLDAEQRSMEAGFALHLGKPADYAKVVDAVAELARERTGLSA